MQDRLVLINSLLGDTGHLGRIHASDILLGIDCGQIQLGIFEILIKHDCLLKMLDRLFRKPIFIGPYALVQLAASFELVASRGAEQSGCDCQ